MKGCAANFTAARIAQSVGYLAHNQRERLKILIIALETVWSDEMAPNIRLLTLHFNSYRLQELIVKTT